MVWPRLSTTSSFKYVLIILRHHFCQVWCLYLMNLKTPLSGLVWSPLFTANFGMFFQKHVKHMLDNIFCQVWCLYLMNPITPLLGLFFRGWSDHPFPPQMLISSFRNVFNIHKTTVWCLYLLNSTNHFEGWIGVVLPPMPTTNFLKFSIFCNWVFFL